MKPRSSLNMMLESSSPLEVKNSKSRTELSTPEFPRMSPDFFCSSPKQPTRAATMKRKNSRTQTFFPYSRAENNLNSSPIERKCSSPDHFGIYSHDSSKFASLRQSPDYQIETSEVIEAARESLQQLRLEARNCFSSSRKLIRDSQRSGRSSVASEEMKNMLSFCNTEINDPIKELVENINSIKNRILLNELNHEQHLKDDDFIKESVERIEAHLKVDEKTIEKKSFCISCNKNCIIL